MIHGSRTRWPGARSRDSSGAWGGALPATRSACLVRIAIAGLLSGGPLEDGLEPRLGLLDGRLHVAGALVLQGLGEHVRGDVLRLGLAGLLAGRRRPARPLARLHHLL